MYVLINNAPDGRHVRVYKTVDAARKAASQHLGREVVGNGPWISDWGNRLVIERRAAGHTASLERRLADAYDARECGTATSAQIALLEKLGY